MAEYPATAVGMVQQYMFFNALMHYFDVFVD